MDVGGEESQSNHVAATKGLRSSMRVPRGRARYTASRGLWPLVGGLLGACVRAAVIDGMRLSTETALGATRLRHRAVSPGRPGALRHLCRECTEAGPAPWQMPHLPDGP